MFLKCAPYFLVCYSQQCVNHLFSRLFRAEIRLRLVKIMSLVNFRVVQRVILISLPPSCFWQLSVRGKNKKEKLEDFFKNVVKSADGVLVAGVKVSHVNKM